MSMLLAIDEGNTNTVIAVFDGSKVKAQWRLSTQRGRTADEYGVYLHQLLDIHAIERKTIKHVVISSVVPQNLFALRKMAEQYVACKPLIVGEQPLKLEMGIVIDRPQEVGADRLVNAVAAKRHVGSGVIVIDFGTATTFDVINHDGDYAGGVIAPGVNLSIAALHAAAAKLPEIAIERPEKVMGTSTVSAMQSGVYWGYVGMIEGIIARLKSEQGDTLKTVATGGLASLFSKATQAIEFHMPDLTIEGLRLIFDMNKDA